MNELSRTQIDKLGERLKKDELTEEDLTLLDQFRQSFAVSYHEVVGKIVSELGIFSSGRLAKSTPSISDKLRRESIRLTQIQDIAGCRIVVEDIEAQDKLTADISSLFAKVSIVDRRTRPSNGYRAVHLIVRSTSKAVEVQIRTELQHQWAELSEKLADQSGHGLKYGVGDPSTLEVLSTASELIAMHESLERRLIKTCAILTDFSGKGNFNPSVQEAIRGCQEDLAKFKKTIQQRRSEILKVLQGY